MRTHVIDLTDVRVLSQRIKIGVSPTQTEQKSRLSPDDFNENSPRQSIRTSQQGRERETHSPNLLDKQVVQTKTSTKTNAFFTN